MKGFFDSVKIQDVKF